MGFEFQVWEWEVLDTGADWKLIIETEWMWEAIATMQERAENGARCLKLEWRPR